MTIISIIIIVTISPERVALIAVMPYYLRVLMAVFGARIILNLREVAVRGERGGLGMSTVAVQAEGQGGEGDEDGDVGRTGTVKSAAELGVSADIDGGWWDGGFQGWGRWCGGRSDSESDLGHGATERTVRHGRISSIVNALPRLVSDLRLPQSKTQWMASLRSVESSMKTPSTAVESDYDSRSHSLSYTVGHAQPQMQMQTQCQLRSRSRSRSQPESPSPPPPPLNTRPLTRSFSSTHSSASFWSHPHSRGHSNSLSSPYAMGSPGRGSYPIGPPSSPPPSLPLPDIPYSNYIPLQTLSPPSTPMSTSISTASRTAHSSPLQPNTIRESIETRVV